MAAHTAPISMARKGRPSSGMAVMAMGIHRATTACEPPMMVPKKNSRKKESGREMGN